MKKNRIKKAEKSSVRLAIEILEKDIEPIYGGSKRLSRLYLHEQPNNKYYKAFKKIIDYLVELRGKNKNPLKFLMRDYFCCVYDYYKRFDRIPPTTNLAPSSANIIRFEDWVSGYYRNTGEEYWMQELPEKIEIIEVPIEVIDLPSITET